MKLITAVIKPFKVDEVRQAVADIGIQGVTVTEVHGYGRHQGHTEIYRGAEYPVGFLPKAKVELAVDDTIAEQVMEAVCNVARTGQDGRWQGVDSRTRASTASAYRGNRPGRHLTRRWSEPRSASGGASILRFRSISRRQASQLPRRCDIPAARVLQQDSRRFLYPRARRKTLGRLYIRRIQYSMLYCSNSRSIFRC